MQNQKIVNFIVNKDKLSANLKSFNNIGKVFYPLKPNSDNEIINELTYLALLNNINLGFLVTNISHFEKLVTLGIDTTNIGAMNVLLNDNDIKYLYDNGIRNFTFHNIDQIISFSKYADLSNTKINIRLSIAEPFKQFSHLGGNTLECKKMLQLISKLGCKDYGLSFYLQKEIIKTPNSLELMLDYITDNFKNFGLKFINIGGAKKTEEIDKNKLAQIKRTLGISHFVLEPARYLVGNAVDMETKIIETKTILDKPCIIIQNGIYSGLVDTLLYSKHFEYKIETDDGFIELEEHPHNDANFEFYMCGGSSDSGDKLGRFFINERFKELLKRETKIIIPNTGCYVAEFFMPLGGDLTKHYKFEHPLEKKKTYSK